MRIFFWVLAGAWVCLACSTSPAPSSSPDAPHADLADLCDTPDMPSPPDAVTELRAEFSAPDGLGETRVAPAVVGETVDEQIPRALESGYDLPAAWYESVAEMGLELADLAFPDIGLTADWDLSRLHWTDTIRHEAHRAPTFGYMVIEDVVAAVEEQPAQAVLRELVVAAHTYNSRDGFVTSRYDREIEVIPGPDVLFEALREFYEQPVAPGHPNPPTAPWEGMRTTVTEGVKALPQPIQVALAQAIYGLLEAARLREEALLSKGIWSLADWEAQLQKSLKGFTPYDSVVLDYAHPGFDFELMARAGQMTVRSTESLRVALAEQPPVAGGAFTLVGPLGRIRVDLTDTDNLHKETDGFLLVDGHGNDTYHGRVAATLSIYQPLSVVLDLHGNDTYAPGNQWEVTADSLTGYRLPMQGAGLYGVALLDDASGDDRYGCLTTGQGFAVFGVGMLVDHAGSDEYEGYDYAQGSAEFGLGLLLDRGDGHDRYETLQHSQGYGGPRGIGWLVDEAGDDSYLAIEEPIIFDWAGEGTNFSGSQGFAFGFRGGPYWSGGLGGLFDLAGNDTYQCAVMCLGFGYFFGTGLFYDRAGDDQYVNTHKYTLGSATHQSVGLFIDEQGADSYLLEGDDEAIGLGYDHGVAYHLDRGVEDDVYTVENVGHFTLGFARHPALGTLINEGGNDEYNIPGDGSRTCGRSWVDANDRQGALAKVITMALFLDLGGAGDQYNIAREEIANGQSWRQTEPLGDGWNELLDFAMGKDVE